MPSLLQAPEKLWRISDALTLIRSLQVSVKPFGYHITLGGGVLNTGSSRNDLDLYFLPLSGSSDEPKLLAFLTEFWGKSVDLRSKAGRKYKWSRGASGEPTIVRQETSYPLDPLFPSAKIFYFSDLRIDVFIARRGEVKAPADSITEKILSPIEASRELSEAELEQVRDEFRFFAGRARRVGGASPAGARMGVDVTVPFPPLAGHTFTIPAAQEMLDSVIPAPWIADAADEFFEEDDE